MKRCERLIAELKKRNLDAAVLHRSENMRYITDGYTGEGCVFVCADELVIVTDFRYVEQATIQCPGARVVSTSAKYRENDAILGLTDEHAVKALAVESDFLSHDSYEALNKHLPFVELASLQGIPEELRLIKDAGEIESIKASAAIACRAFENILDKIHPGMTEKQVQILLDFEMLSLGSEGNAFDTIAAAGPNGSLCHAIPSSRVIQKGELLTLDFGAKVNGYCSDMTRTIGFGKVSAELKEMYELVYEAHMRSLNAVKPGMVCGDIDKIARDLLDARYPGAFGHSLGHGVGLFIHEQPRVASGSETVLQPGYVITIEPGVYIPGLGGCRIEDMAILTSDGYLDPVTSPKQLIEL
ncbi:MAG: aminopeptidase P family protein [Clostridia bacterium]|nr:aminopeptidase P family protein [Clostridia bacterium]